MIRRLTTSAALLCAVALTLPQTAAAKGPITDLTVCGATGCKAVPIPARLMQMDGLEVLMSSPELGIEPTPGPFYKLRITLGEKGSLGGRTRIPLYYLPGGVIVRQGSWQRLSPAMASDMDEAVHTLPPFVPTVAGVRITRGRVHDRAAYAALLRPLPLHHPDTLAANVVGGIGIYVRTTTPTPWGTGGIVFSVYDPATGVVTVADEPRVPTDALRQAIERDAGLSPKGDGHAAAVVWAGGILAAVSAALVLLRRSRRRPAGGSGVA